MARVTAPFLSFGGRGQIAKTMVGGVWKGRPYMRQYVIPANPNTAGQQTTRNIFRNMNTAFKLASPLWVAPWTRFAQGQVLTDRNAFIGQNIAAMRGDTDLANMIFSPGAKGGLPPDSIAIVVGAGQLTVNFTNPTPPAGWTLAAAVAVAVLDQNPDTGTDWVSTTAEDAPAAASVVLTGLTASALYRVGGFLRWTKPDGSTAFGASLVDTGTPT